MTACRVSRPSAGPYLVGPHTLGDIARHPYARHPYAEIIVHRGS